MPGAEDATTDEQRDFILDLLAEFQGPAYICRAFQSAFGRSIAKSLVSYYKKQEKHQESILLRRARLRSTIRERIPLASKFHRLRELQKLFDSENHYRVVRYTKGVNSRGTETQVPIFEKPIGELRAIAHLIAQEMGDLTEVHVNLDKPRDEYRANFEDGEAYEDTRPPEAPDVPTEVTH